MISQFYARRTGRQGAPVIINLVDDDGNECGSVSFDRISNDWRKYEAVITSTKTVDNASLVITTKGNGTLYLDMVSLFPQKTFNNRKNGLRADLVQALKDLNPKFFRFPWRLYCSWSWPGECVSLERFGW